MSNKFEVEEMNDTIQARLADFENCKIEINDNNNKLMRLLQQADELERARQAKKTALEFKACSDFSVGEIEKQAAQRVCILTELECIEHALGDLLKLIKATETEAIGLRQGKSDSRDTLWRTILTEAIKTLPQESLRTIAVAQYLTCMDDVSLLNQIKGKLVCLEANDIETVEQEYGVIA